MGKIDRTGEERVNNDGILMKIINYNKYNDIDVLFLESGYIAKHKSYGKFKIGSIKDKSEYDKRLGEMNTNKQGYNMKIIEYNSSINITIQFEDGTIVKNKTYNNFLNGDIDKNKVRVKVFNTGDNIKEEDLNRIWNRFYKVDESRNREDGGTGIGLSFVKAIMNNYGNNYGVINKEDGVEFYFELDLRQMGQS